MFVHFFVVMKQVEARFKKIEDWQQLAEIRLKRLEEQAGISSSPQMSVDNRLMGLENVYAAHSPMAPTTKGAHQHNLDLVDQQVQRVLEELKSASEVVTYV